VLSVTYVHADARFVMVEIHFGVIEIGLAAALAKYIGVILMPYSDYLSSDKDLALPGRRGLCVTAAR